MHLFFVRGVSAAVVHHGRVTVIKETGTMDKLELSK